MGLAYLTLSRQAGTLSGGESQRIRLATQIGSSLMGVLYILDEPSIGPVSYTHLDVYKRQAWYLVYGGTLRPYVEESGVTPTLSSVVSNNLNASFFQGESDQGILRLFDGLETWCAAALPVLDLSLIHISRWPAAS